MKRSDFNKIWDKVIAECTEINRTKGNDYAGDSDALRNFKEVAARTGMTPLQCWGVYWAKHVMAVETRVQNGAVESEPIESRINDIIVYMILLRALLEEENENR